MIFHGPEYLGDSFGGLIVDPIRGEIKRSHFGSSRSTFLVGQNASPCPLPIEYFSLQYPTFCAGLSIIVRHMDSNNLFQSSMTLMVEPHNSAQKERI
jgi:hypothetical protein